MINSLIYILKMRLGLLIYGGLSVLEGILNSILYLTFLDKIMPVADFSLPFYMWWSDKVLKYNWLKGMKEQNKEYGQDI
jgi:hypothetical protein